MEVWKEIKGYEGHYEVSSYGNVRSLERLSWNGRVWHTHKGRDMKKVSDGFYFSVGLSKNNKVKTFRVHSLVANAFLDRPIIDGRLEVDHIDNDKTNNKLINLQFISQRDNTIKAIDKTNKSSKYTGVCWHKYHKLWMSIINIKDYKKSKYFKDELEASEWYKNEVKNYEQKRVNREVTFS